jgi:hypothetical protein
MITLSLRGMFHLVRGCVWLPGEKGKCACDLQPLLYQSSSRHTKSKKTSYCQLAWRILRATTNSSRFGASDRYRATAPAPSQWKRWMSLGEALAAGLGMEEFLALLALLAGRNTRPIIVPLPVTATMTSCLIKSCSCAGSSFSPSVRMTA